MESLDGWREKREALSINPKGLTLSDNLEKAKRNFREMIQFSCLWQRLKKLSSWGRRRLGREEGQAPAAACRED